MRVFQLLLFLASSYAAAWTAAYCVVSELHPASSHALKFFGVPVPGGEFANATLTFSWAFFLAIIGLALAYKQSRNHSLP